MENVNWILIKEASSKNLRYFIHPSGLVKSIRTLSGGGFKERLLKVQGQDPSQQRFNINGRPHYLRKLLAVAFVLPEHDEDNLAVIIDVSKPLTASNVCWMSRRELTHKLIAEGNTGCVMKKAYRTPVWVNKKKSCESAAAASRVLGCSPALVFQVLAMKQENALTAKGKQIRAVASPAGTGTGADS